MAERARDHLGRFGVWRGVSLVTPELATLIEELGFGALWLGGSPSADLDAVEQLVAATSTGGDAAVAAQLAEHFDAGADHVCVQLLTASDDDLPDGYRHLARALGLSAT